MPDGFIASPNYPLNYDNNQNCDLGVLISGTIYNVAFNTENGEDYVTVKSRINKLVRNMIIVLI